MAVFFRSDYGNMKAGDQQRNATHPEFNPIRVALLNAAKYATDFLARSSLPPRLFPEANSKS